VVLLIIPRTIIKHFCCHPLFTNGDIDSNKTALSHRSIINENSLLRKHYIYIYQHFRAIEDSLGNMPFPSLEIGSGVGFLKEFIPTVVTSDVVAIEGIDRTEDATHLTFPNNSLKAIYAKQVLHHIYDPQKCLEEVQRVLVPGGMFVCDEPSTTLFGYFINRYFHHEYANKRVIEWKAPTIDTHGWLRYANTALPYIIFKRDVDLFRKRLTQLQIISIHYHDFLRYAFSGGLTYRPLIPKLLYDMVDIIEAAFTPYMSILGTCMIVTIRKTSGG